ncbi:uncharacterized protein L3040_007343 [Drepanopeziza brunnea f. sp. 'multigermtubi']|uniref:Monooxygenase n=1 Tax=Marssonina brunnea f. sp. multigermtubi (strain MB_m1) TaxID=1072389 RepID=K1WK76_MARBU|nr:monooxygenase [Drepanopeziza brunnea f. sp. 'multigermtubi' MB_m1]EKD13266.1 monooxygenase [Drepanopeziza brunnea f. sp. 'multigermtubi' MB_m1]KAJ5037163.1 hypothetical protein L3040_007343 [Drepanopeziza brunnea f. sp. 'multigermtubi']
MWPQDLDALVVGAGFGGIYQLKKLLDQGLNVKAIDKAGDVGGTWYWNRYPGAMSDTRSFLYRYSWDHEDLVEYPWDSEYLQGPEILKYLEHVVERHHLRPHFQFGTEMLGADWSDSERRWTVALSTGEVVKTTYLVTALGLLSRTNFPQIHNLDQFAGELYHTAAWPRDADLRGKRVGVIGNGSTGVQLITALAKSEELQQLLCFQRNPQYTVPAGNGPVTREARKALNENYRAVWEEAMRSKFAFGIHETTRTTASVSAEERERIYEEAWAKGNGFCFMFETFGDISIDEAANTAAADFIQRKIRAIVQDKEKARKLCPTQWYARRPLCDSNYYEQFNRANVDIVDIKTHPITELTPAGIKTADGRVYELDVLICATGFDAVDGNYTRMCVRGRGGETLKDHWAETGPTSYLGMSVANFPNLFMVLGPNGPFSNQPPAIESQVDFIAELIARAESTAPRATVRGPASAQANGFTMPEPTQAQGGSQTQEAGPGVVCRGVIEAELEAEKSWTEHCERISADSLFRRVDSWIFGKNIPGKKAATVFYFGGLGAYRKEVRDRIEDDLRGFRVS